MDNLIPPEASDPRKMEFRPEHLQYLRNARDELCKITDAPTGIPWFFEKHAEVTELIAKIEKLMGII